VSEGYKQKEATATYLRFLAGLATAANRLAVASPLLLDSCVPRTAAPLS
jgi:hypothetical protein